MKKTILVLLSVMTLALAGLGWARSAHHGPGFQRLTDSLDLEPQQAEQVSQVLQEQRDKRETLHMQMRADMQAIEQDTLERLRPLLSAEQLQKFIELSEARRAKHARRGPKHAPPAPAQ